MSRRYSTPEIVAHRYAAEFAATVVDPSVMIDGDDGNPFPVYGYNAAVERRINVAYIGAWLAAQAVLEMRLPPISAATPDSGLAEEVEKYLMDVCHDEPEVMTVARVVAHDIAGDNHGRVVPAQQYIDAGAERGAGL